VDEWLSRARDAIAENADRMNVYTESGRVS